MTIRERETLDWHHGQSAATDNNKFRDMIMGMSEWATVGDEKQSLEKMNSRSWEARVAADTVLRLCSICTNTEINKN